MIADTGKLTSSPPSRKGGDSLHRRSMSRTEEDIESGVDITIMRDATLSTYPASYSEVCDTFRPRLAGARRTDSGRKRFIHLLVPSPVRRRFVTEHVSEGRPAFEVFKAQVDANTTLHRPRLGLSDFHDN